MKISSKKKNFSSETFEGMEGSPSGTQNLFFIVPELEERLSALRKSKPAFLRMTQPKGGTVAVASKINRESG